MPLQVINNALLIARTKLVDAEDCCCSSSSAGSDTVDCGRCVWVWDFDPVAPKWILSEDCSPDCGPCEGPYEDLTYRLGSEELYDVPCQQTESPLP